MSRPNSRQPKSGYHHGDLRRGLMVAGLELIREQGIDAMSLRKLAERVGVSQTALYHHFKDKQALLCALGEEAMAQFGVEVRSLLAEPGQSIDQRLEAFVLAYVRFATDNPERYELMFGRTTWKQSAEADFHKNARQGFRAFGEMLAALQAQGVLPTDVDPLRLAQVAWATLHGLCRMYNDGLAFTTRDLEDISLYALRLMRRAIGWSPKS